MELSGWLKYAKGTVAFQTITLGPGSGSSAALLSMPRIVIQALISETGCSHPALLQK